MQSSAKSPPNKGAPRLPASAPPTDPYLDKLNELLAAAVERVEQLKAALAVHREMNGDPAPSCRSAGFPPGVARPRVTHTVPPKPTPTVASKRERQTILARAMLTAPITFSEAGKILNASNDAVAKLLRSPWFCKVGGAAPGTPAPWTLTDLGKAVVTRSALPPAPTGELRPNADLDDIFLSELRRGPDVGKISPRPFGSNGAGAAHTNGTAAKAEPTAMQVLRLLTERPMAFTVLCRLLPVNPSSTNKAINALQAKGLVEKGRDQGHKSPWSITPAGREELARG